MQGSSRGALAAGRAALEQVLEQSPQQGVDGSALAAELFAIAVALDSSASLRRALTDPSREAAAKRDLAGALFGGKVSEVAGGLLAELVGQRWSHERHLSDAVETLAVEAEMSSAEAAGHLDSVEDELFRFGRIVAGSADLRDALRGRESTGQDKAGLVQQLLEGKVSAETVTLVRQAVLAPRGRRLDRTLSGYLAVAARRRQQVTATVTAAATLDHAEEERLAAALAAHYDKPVQLNVIVDPAVLGGLRVQVGDEVVDGTILRRLDEAKRRLTG